MVEVETPRGKQVVPRSALKVVEHNEAIKDLTIDKNIRREEELQEELEKAKEERNIKTKPKDPTKLEGEFKKMFDTANEELKEIFKLEEKKVGHDEAWKKYQVKKEKSYREFLKQQQESYHQDSNTGGELNDN